MRTKMEEFLYDLGLENTSEIFPKALGCIRVHQDILHLFSPVGSCWWWKASLSWGSNPCTTSWPWVFSLGLVSFGECFEFWVRQARGRKEPHCWMSSPGGTDLGLLQPVALLYLKRHGKMSKLVTKGLNYESEIKKKPGVRNVTWWQCWLDAK